MNKKNNLLDEWRENGICQNENMGINALSEEDVTKILNCLGYNVDDDNFLSLHRKEHFDYVKSKGVFYRNDCNTVDYD